VWLALAGAMSHVAPIERAKSDAVNARRALGRRILNALRLLMRSLPGLRWPGIAPNRWPLRPESSVRARSQGHSFSLLLGGPGHKPYEKEVTLVGYHGEGVPKCDRFSSALTALSRDVANPPGTTLLAGRKEKRDFLTLLAVAVCFRTSDGL
jgi:hypothetical protein